MTHGRRITTKIKTNLKVLDKFEKLEKTNPTNPIGLGRDNGSKRIAHTRMLTRIIIFLRDIKYPVTITQIEEAIGNKTYCNDALNWLVNNKVVIKEWFTNQEIFSYKGNHHGYLYYINPKWEELKENKIL